MATLKSTTIDGELEATGDIIAFSDARLKTDLEVIDAPIERLMKISGYTYNRTDKDLKQAGVIAQELLEVLPEVVSENADGILRVNYDGIIPLLIEAIKAQQEKIEELESKVK